MRLSIRWRLTLWNMLALAIMLLGFGGLVYELLSRSLYQRIDQTLVRELQELQRDRRMQTEGEGRLRYWIYEFKEHDAVHAVVFDAQGKLLAKTEELAEASIPPAPPPPDQMRIGDGSTPILGRQRMLVGRVLMSDQPLTVVLMAGLSDVDRELALLVTTLATAGPIALLLGGALAYWMARKALAPMEQLHQLTQGITAEHLDRRLPIINSGDELGQLTQTINSMIGRLEKSFAEIRRFTADASHELRTPLTAIRTEAEVALHKSLDVAECKELLGSILEECDRLTRMTDQLLTLAREDAGERPASRERVDLVTVVASVTETMTPVAEANGVQLRIVRSTPLWVRGEEGRLRQVVYNLLENSIKYTPAGGKIEVTLVGVSGAVVLTVRDTGIGIPAEHLARVFERFYRVDKARSREMGGTGLGLSIVQSIVQAHDGQVTLASTPSQGTTCTVTLPFAPEKDRGIVSAT